MSNNTLSDIGDKLRAFGQQIASKVQGFGRNVMAQGMSYTQKIDAIKAEIDKRNRNLRRLQHEIENFDIAMSNLKDDRNVAYYQSRKRHAKNQIQKERFIVEQLQQEIEMLMQKLKTEQVR